MAIREVLAKLVTGSTLGVAEAADAFEDLLGGLLDDAQIAAMLALIQARGVTVDELVAGATVMRRHAAVLPGLHDGRDPLPGPILDTCGTGGAPKTFNISTAVAVVTAAAAPPDADKPVFVAKHGGRSRTGRGSADVLAVLGVNVDASPKVQARCLRQAGICFSFAVHHHPAMKHAAGARRSVGFPTMFNLLGPLTNPAGATHQLLGVYDPAAALKVATALSRLGSSRAWVVHGEVEATRDGGGDGRVGGGVGGGFLEGAGGAGLDEVSISGVTRVAEVEAGSVRMREIDARELGVERVPLEALACGSVTESASRVLGVLGGEVGPSRDIVVVNAAAALYVARAAADLEEGMAMAAKAIATGDALRTLGVLRTLSHEEG
jgi:anthranilate phosphoribosyltransferase